MPILTVPKMLREKLGDDGTDALVELLNQASAHAKADVLGFVEEKFERRLTEEVAKFNERLTTEIGKVNERLTVEIGKVNERLTTEIGKVNERLTTEIGKVNERLTVEIAKMNDRLSSELAKLNAEFPRLRQELAEVKADLIRWMFIFWVGQLGAILGILFAFFRR
jgi:flagellar capping protein FliD